MRKSQQGGSTFWNDAGDPDLVRVCPTRAHEAN